MHVGGVRSVRGTLLALAVYSCGNNANPFHRLKHLFRHQLGELQNESGGIRLGFVLGFAWEHNRRDVVKVAGVKDGRIEDEDDASVFDDESRGAEMSVCAWAIKASPELEGRR
jgi:hypothetical protein